MVAVKVCVHDRTAVGNIDHVKPTPYPSHPEKTKGFSKHRHIGTDVHSFVAMAKPNLLPVATYLRSLKESKNED